MNLLSRVWIYSSIVLRGPLSFFKMPRTNPFSLFRNPLLYFESKSHQRLQEFYGAMNVTALDAYEKTTLIPGLLSRLDAFLELSNDILLFVDRDKDLAKDLDTALQSRFNPAFQQFGKAPLLGAQYLSKISEITKSQIVAPIEALKREYPDITAFKDADDLARFCEKFSFFCSGMYVTGDLIFTYSLRGFPIITNKKDGRELVGQPQDLAVILSPFKIYIDNIGGLAKSTYESIELWGKKRQDNKGRFLNWLERRAKLKAARWLFMIQILMILIAISTSAAFMVGGYTFNLIQENRRLQMELNETKPDLPQ